MKIYIIVGLFILLDVITGLLKALKGKTFTSSVMREGIYHKVGEILIIAFGALVDYAQQFMDLGVSVPLTLALSILVVMMEIGSIIENICAINPEILPSKIKVYFAKLKTEDAEENVEEKNEKK